jgi:hypothetical protein
VSRRHEFFDKAGVLLALNDEGRLEVNLGSGWVYPSPAGIFSGYESALAAETLRLAFRVAELEAEAVEHAGALGRSLAERDRLSELLRGLLETGAHGAWYCAKCDRWQDPRSGCEGDIREDERQKGEGERDRLRAAVGDWRAWGVSVLNLVKTAGWSHAARQGEDLLAENGEASEAWLAAQLREAREMGRQEIRGGISGEPE